MTFYPKLQFLIDTGNSPVDLSGIRRHAQQQAWRKRRLKSLTGLKKHSISSASGGGSCTGSVLSNKQSALQPQASYLDEVSAADPYSSTNLSLTRSDLSVDHNKVAQNVPLDRNWSAFDPFKSAAIDIDRTLGQHLMFFATQMWPAYTEWQSASTFLSTFGSLAIEDAGLLFAIAASAAVRIESRRKAHSIQVSFQKREHEILYTNATLQIVRQKIGDPATSTSDMTIGLIAFLAMFEAVDHGRTEHSVIHLGAIEQLIASKGGHEKISWLWYERILAADVKTASTAISKPRLEVPRDNEKNQIILDAISQVEPALVSASRRHWLNLDFTKACLQIITDVQNLVLLCNIPSTERRRSSRLSSDVFSYQRLAIEHRLLRLMASSNCFGPTEACLHIGILIFINTVFWSNFQSGCPLLSNLSLELRNRLLALDSLGLDSLLAASACAHIQVWLAFLGAYASKNVGIKPWFIARLKTGLESLQLHSDRQIRDSLRMGLYAPSVYDTELLAILKIM